jgi:hypothetical protein
MFRPFLCPLEIFVQVLGEQEAVGEATLFDVREAFPDALAALAAVGIADEAVILEEPFLVTAGVAILVFEQTSHLPYHDA